MMTGHLLLANPAPGLTRGLPSNPHHRQKPEAPGQARGGYSREEGTEP